MSARFVYVVGLVAIASATPALADSLIADEHKHRRAVDDGVCSPLRADSCLTDHQDVPLPVTNSFADIRCDHVRGTGNFSKPPCSVQRLEPDGTPRSPELALCMFVEFLKVAPLIMGLGCIMTIFVALRQKFFLDLSESGGKVKIQWTKPVTC